LSGCKLVGRSFRGQTLQGYSFRGADLSRTDFTDAYIQDVDFSGANLTNAIFADSTMQDTNIANANFRNVTFKNIESSNLNGIPVNIPLGWVLWKGCMIGKGAVLIDVDISDAILKGMDLTGVDFIRTDISNVDFSGSVLTGVTTSDLTGLPKQLPARWSIKSGHLIGQNAVVLDGIFINESFAGADLSGVDFTDSEFDRVRSGGINGVPFRLPENWQLADGYLLGPTAQLQGAKLDNVALSKINLDFANLKGAILKNVSFDQGSISSAILDSASLEDVKFRSTDVTNTSIRSAKLNRIRCSNLEGFFLNLPTGWSVQKGLCLGTTAVLSDSDISGVVLTNLNLSSAVLTNVRSSNLVGSTTLLPRHWKLMKGYLIGPTSNLENVDLQNMNFSSMNLKGINLTNTTITNVNFTYTDLTGAKLDKAKIYGSRFVYANLSEVSLLNATIVNANFASARLDRSIIRNTELSASIITGLSFNRAKLVAIKSTDLKGLPSMLPSGIVLHKGILVGPTMVLTYADFSRSNLSKMNLEGANLSGASFYSANLNEANLKGAITIGTDFTRAQMKNTICPNGERAHSSLGCQGKFGSVVFK
jgi:uncharacterized protein YjbI with pentapeptide repeats